MLRKCKAEITIRRVSRGYIVEWEQERVRQKHSFQSIGIGGEPEDWSNPSGVEVFDTQKKALDFIKATIG